MHAPVAAPPAATDAGAAETLRAAIRVAVEDALSSALAWQRDAEARIARAELELATLQVAARARAQQVAAPPQVPIQSATAPVAAVEIARPAPAPLPAATVSLVARPPLPSVDLEPFDEGMLPDELNGGRRKRALAWGALLFLLLGLGTLVALAILSQAKHGN